MDDLDQRIAELRAKMREWCTRISRCDQLAESARVDGFPMCEEAYEEISEEWAADITRIRSRIRRLERRRK